MVLPAEAYPAAVIDDSDAFDLLSVPQAVTVLRSIDGEHVLIADGPRCIRLDVVAGSMLSGPVRLGYCLCGFDGVEAKIVTLRRLLAVWRLGRLPLSLFPPERKARRWAIALPAYDGMGADASPRHIAIALFGERRVQEDWGGRSDYLRLRVQRLISGRRHDDQRGLSPPSSQLIQERSRLTPGMISHHPPGLCRRIAENRCADQSRLVLTPSAGPASASRLSSVYTIAPRSAARARCNASPARMPSAY